MDYLKKSRVEEVLIAILGKGTVTSHLLSRIEKILDAIRVQGSYNGVAMSEVEEILICILRGEPFDKPTHSRIAAMLKIKANGGQYTELRKSRVENLIFEWINAVEHATYIGTLPATLQTIEGYLDGYKIYGNTGGVGVETEDEEPAGYKLPIVSSQNKYVNMLKNANIRDQITVDGIVWDVIGIDHDEVYKEDGTIAQHTVTIQTHDCFANLQFDAREALFAFPNGLAAGTYNFTIRQHSWVPSDVNKSITFTLTQAIPSGGQLVVNQSYNDSFTTGSISSYASPIATQPIETVEMNEGNAGVSLGDVTNAIVGYTNSCQRALFGSNRWETSEIKQYLNSDKAAGQVWTPQTVFDRPPSWAASAAGFLYGMDPDFLSVLGKAKKRTALNTVSDGGGYKDSVEKVFLLSRSELYGGDEGTGGEGAAYPYYANHSDLPSPGTGNDSNRIKYRNGVAQHWWFRTPLANSTVSMRKVTPVGGITNDTSSKNYGVAPAVCVIMDDITTTDIYIGDTTLAKDEYVDSETGKIYRRTENLSPPEEEWVDGQIGGGDGTVHPSTQIKVSPFIDVSACEICIMEIFSTTDDWAEPGYREMAFYDENKQYLGWIGGGGRQILLPNEREMLSEFPEGTAYVRIGCSHTDQPFYPQLLSGDMPAFILYPYHIQTNPPAPLPQIPTFAETTVIDYDGEPKPEKVELKYATSE